MRHTDVRGPLDDEPHQAGVVSEGQLQHAIAVQREQVEFPRLGALLDGHRLKRPRKASPDDRSRSSIRGDVDGPARGAAV